jgi:uncharacterized protein
MLPFEDVYFQLVDLPPISAEYFEGWLPNTLQTADAALLVVDVADPACADDLGAIRESLDAKKVTLTEHWPRGGGWHAADADEDAIGDPFRRYLPALLVVNKIDLDPTQEDIEVLKELAGVRFPTLAVSALRGDALDAIGAYLFRELGVVRVYTKAPGKPPELDRPFTLRAGATVLDVARLVHKEVAEHLKYARAWGSGVFDGQQVGPEHRVADRDVVELHMR